MLVKDLFFCYCSSAFG